MKENPKIKIGVSIAEDSLSFARKMANDHFSGNLSAFFQSLLDESENRASRNPEALDSDVVVKLARALLGELDAEDLAHKLSEKDQRRVLRQLLDGLLHGPL